MLLLDNATSRKEALRLKAIVNPWTTAAFIVLILLSAYLGLSTQRIPTPYQSDKGLHFVTFFLLTVSYMRVASRCTSCQAAQPYCGAWKYS